MEIDGKIINKLIGLQEIAETKEVGNKMLSLHHSSIAELYFEAYLREYNIGRRIRKNILNGKNEKNLEFCLFYRYLITAYSRNAVGVVISLHEDFINGMGGITLLNNLIEYEKIQQSIVNGIDKEEDIKKVENSHRKLTLFSHQF